MRVNSVVIPRIDSWRRRDGSENKSLIDGRERVDKGVECKVKILWELEYVANSCPVS